MLHYAGYNVNFFDEVSSLESGVHNLVNFGDETMFNNFNECSWRLIVQTSDSSSESSEVQTIISDDYDDTIM
jgi:hypothetical protein